MEIIKNDENVLVAHSEYHNEKDKKKYWKAFKGLITVLAVFAIDWLFWSIVPDGIKILMVAMTIVPLYKGLFFLSVFIPEKLPDYGLFTVEIDKVSKILRIESQSEYSSENIEDEKTKVHLTELEELTIANNGRYCNLFLLFEKNNVILLELSSQDAHEIRDNIHELIQAETPSVQKAKPELLYQNEYTPQYAQYDKKNLFNSAILSIIFLGIFIFWTDRPESFPIIIATGFSVFFLLFEIYHGWSRRKWQTKQSVELSSNFLGKKEEYLHSNDVIISDYPLAKLNDVEEYPNKNKYHLDCTFGSRTRATIDEIPHEDLEPLKKTLLALVPDVSIKGDL